MTDAILYWNQVALDAVKTDFSTADPTIPPNPQQPGPTYCSRALAIVHLAMHDAYLAIRGTGSAKTYLDYIRVQLLWRPRRLPCLPPRV